MYVLFRDFDDSNQDRNKKERNATFDSLLHYAKSFVFLSFFLSFFLPFVAFLQVQVLDRPFQR
jgi:hypothetical protein